MEIVTLGDLFKISSGGTPSRREKSYYDNGDIPWIKTGDLHKVRIQQASEYITQLGLDKSSAKLFPKDTVLLAMYGATIGACSILDIEAATNQACAAFVPNEKVDTNYLYYFLKSKKNDFIRDGVGGAQPNISATYLKTVDFPFPSLETQKQIAAVLEKADQLRKDCQQMEQELNNLAQSVFIDMFGDPVTNPKGWDVGIIGEMLSSANYGTSEKSSTEKKKFPVLRMNNITYEGNWDFSALKYMDMSKEDENKYLVKSGDILFNRTNSKELVGKTAVYREATSMAYAGYLVRARCNELAHPDYISSFMNSKYGKKTLQSMCKSIVGMANINAKEFQKIKIAKPPVELQEKFAIRVAAIRTKVADVKQQEAEYNLLFNALMQKAFKGELNL
ncbi:restriction endonuclease subunit S [Vibrio sp. NC2]|uniref:restriction endonuclease subunit S n=1 Tax=Vibrio sp. NC2 TaxID=2974562 RepID=UPI0021A81557|nr:restriction endonuclease subunit S [Vibrio sp. NC2]MCT4351255.1 restriction endonuclease subunit S [Vibrio sp. NC2]